MIYAYFLFLCLAGPQQEGPPGPYDAGPAQGFFLLTLSFSLPLLLVAGQALGFCKGLRDNLIVTDAI